MLFGKKLKKYFLVIVARQEGSYNYIKQIPLTLNNEKIKDVNGKILVFDISKPNIIRNNCNYYYVDIITRQQIFFESDYEKIDGNLLDIIIHDQIITQIIKSVEGNPIKDMLGYILGSLILGGVIGALIGYIIALG